MCRTDAVLPIALALSLATVPRGVLLAQSARTRPTAIRMNFRDVSLDTILEHLSEVAGLAVVRTVAVEGRITVISRQPMSIDQAIALLNTALKERNYAAILTGRILKVVPLAEAKKASIPVRSGSDPEAIEPTDRMITQVIPIRYVDAAKLGTDLAPLIPSYAQLTANASSNALILTDTQANIRRIVEIVRALDQHMAGDQEVAVYQLKYADATDTARLINEIFKEDGASQQQDRRARFSRFVSLMRRGRGRGRGGQEEAAPRRAQEVRASADQRTNTVVISASPDTLKVIEKVVKELDANPLAQQAVFIYHLKNANAKNLETVLNNLFDESRAPGAATGTGRTPTGSVPGRSRTDSRSRSVSSLQRQAQAAAGQTTDLVGQVYCVADEDTNTLLVMTPSKNFDRVKEIIESLDRPVPQVLIKVLIAEVTHEKSVDLGAEFSILNVRSLTQLGTFGGTDFSVAAQTGGLVFRTVENEVTVAIRALEAVGKLDVLSRPYILTSDNQEATIIVGQEVPFIRSSTITDAGQTLNTIQYEDIGIILKVTPHINPDGLVIMNVYPEISTLTGVTIPISDNLNAPVYAKRSAESRVAVRNGQTIVIGGLMEDQKRDNVEKVPILGDLPFVGALFRRTVKATNKTELLIFLTPHVAKEAGQLESMAQDEVKASKLVPKVIKRGAFQEHLNGLKRGAPKPERVQPKPYRQPRR